MKKIDAHIFKGMRKDLSPVRASSEYLYDAKNIRFTVNSDNSETLMAITNEKGPKKVVLYLYNDNNQEEVESTIEGTYLGHAILDTTVILFSVDNNQKSYIYKIWKKPNSNLEEYNIKKLYAGNLGFKVENPIETLPYYESSRVQKVYWVDGINQPRVLNLNNLNEDGEFPADKDNQFDFIQELNLNEVVQVHKRYYGGVFTPGVIQYAFTYFNKYGQETNIFYITELHYINYYDRADSGENRISNSFVITIDNVDTNFDYLRIFSLSRSSINQTPTVKKLEDINIAKNVKEGRITFTDTGTIGAIEDPTYLLYVGGTNIIPKTIASKDNTLFLGNYKYINNSVGKYLDNLSIENYTGAREVSYYPLSTYLVHNSKVNDYAKFTSYNSNISGDRNYDLYAWYNTLDDLHYKPDEDSNNTTDYVNVRGFKTGEYYRFGVQFQNSKGVWDVPILIEDYKITHPNLSGLANRSTEGKSQDEKKEILDYSKEFITKIIVNGVKIELDLDKIKKESSTDSDSLYDFLKKNDYKRARPVIIIPDINNRRVLAEGVICPTVAQKSGKYGNAQSSWFFRPIHLDPGETSNPSGKQGLGAEGCYYSVNFEDEVTRDISIDKKDAKYRPEIQGARSENEDRVFEINNSLVTFHSPEIEFDEQLGYFANQDLSNLDLNIVGAAHVDNNYAKYNVTWDGNNISSVAEPTKEINTYQTFKSVTQNMEYDTTSGWHSNTYGSRVLATMAGVRTGLIRASNNEYNTVGWSTIGQSNNTWAISAFMIHPWQESGSLNNDNRGSEGTVKLKSKYLFNYRFSYFYTRIPEFSSGKTIRKWKSGTTGTSVNDVFETPVDMSFRVDAVYYGSEQPEFVQYVNIEEDQEVNGVYYGNVDTILGKSEADSTYFIVKDPAGTQAIDVGNKRCIFNSIEEQIPNSVIVGNTVYYLNPSDKDRIIHKRNSAATVVMRYKSTPHLLIPLKKDMPTIPYCGDKQEHVIRYEMPIIGNSSESSAPRMTNPLNPSTPQTGVGDEIINSIDQHTDEIIIPGSDDILPIKPLDTYDPHLELVYSDDNGDKDTNYSSSSTKNALKILVDEFDEEPQSSRLLYHDHLFGVSYSLASGTEISSIDYPITFQLYSKQGISETLLVDTHMNNLSEVQPEVDGDTTTYTHVLSIPNYNYIKIEYKKKVTEGGNNTTTFTCNLKVDDSDTAEVLEELENLEGKVWILKSKISINHPFSSSADRIDTEFPINNTSASQCTIQFTSVEEGETDTGIKRSIDGNFLFTSETSDGETTYYPIKNYNYFRLPSYNSFLWLAELVRRGDNNEDYKPTFIDSMQYIPAGYPVDITTTTTTIESENETSTDAEETQHSISLVYCFGDTWLTRYDCLKTYPFALDVENSIVDIFSFMCESRVCVDGRYDKNRFNTYSSATNSNSISPAFTFSPINFNKLNQVYNQLDNFFGSTPLDEDFYKDEEYETTFTWTKTKNPMSKVDTWTNITLANTYGAEGLNGKINAIINYNNDLYLFQDSGIGSIAYNERTQVEPKDGVPIEIINSSKVTGVNYLSSTIGTKNKWSIVQSNDGLFFIDSTTKDLYKITSKGIINISTAKHFNSWFNKLDTSTSWSSNLWNSDSPVNPNRLFYDLLNSDLYLVNKDQCLGYSDYFEEFTSFYSYENTLDMFNLEDEFLAVKNGSNNTIDLWLMNRGDYNQFFGTPQEYSIEFISNPDPTQDKTFTNIEARLINRERGTNASTLERFFDYIQVQNDYQNTGVKELKEDKYKGAILKRKFRTWRVDIPRADDKMFGNRIRDMYCKIKLWKAETIDSNDKIPIEFRDISVVYYD